MLWVVVTDAQEEGCKIAGVFAHKFVVVKIVDLLDVGAGTGVVEMKDPPFPH
ncbi:hypothetical protein RvVAR0630_29390 [Agrobacterium vitis]|nr:hypothetical protein RvVAR0630_29390 [Agrobacterium vitis]